MLNRASTTSPADESKDLLFKCQQCGTALVVDCKAAGMTLNCQRCGQPTAVPCVAPGADSGGKLGPDPAAKLSELQRHLKENESQRIEINGYINQLSIQLHRWQLRLQTLNERNQELTREIAELSGSNRPTT